MTPRDGLPALSVRSVARIASDLAHNRRGVSAISMGHSPWSLV